MKKIKDKKGFSLVEMLVCVLTLLLVGAICTTGTGISIKSYQESRFESDSQMLKNMVETVLSDMFRYATDIKVENGVVTFTNPDYGMADGVIKIEAMGAGGEKRFVLLKNPTATPELMLGNSIYAENLEVADLILNYDATTNVFSGSYRIKSTIMNDAEKNCEFTYRSIAVY